MKKLISKKILISKKASIKSALKSLSSSGKRCLLVMQGKTLCGTLTDGDLRRSILKGALLNQNIENANAEGVNINNQNTPKKLYNIINHLKKQPSIFTEVNFF